MSWHHLKLLSKWPNGEEVFPPQNIFSLRVMPSVVFPQHKGRMCREQYQQGLRHEGGASACGTRGIWQVWGASGQSLWEVSYGSWCR